MENIVVSFLECFDRLKDENILSKKSFKEYWNYNVHSYFQYCLIMSAHQNNFKGVPEYKLKLSKPIDKYYINPLLRGKRTRYMRTIRVDVGFIKRDKLVGMGEIYTPDEINGCLPSRELGVTWITPYDKLTHIAEYEKDITFIILIIGLWTLPYWREAKNKTPQEWYKYWKKLVKQLSAMKNVVAIYIKDLDKIETFLPNIK